jgi:hypothetical protein
LPLTDAEGRSLEVVRDALDLASRRRGPYVAFYRRRA